MGKQAWLQSFNADSNRTFKNNNYWLWLESTCLWTLNQNLAKKQALLTWETEFNITGAQDGDPRAVGGFSYMH